MTSISKSDLTSAEQMVEVFLSVGVKAFTVVGEKNKNQTLFTRKHCDGETTLLNLRGDLLFSKNNSCNLHIRPYSFTKTLIQLDDCNIKDIFPFCVYGCQTIYEEIFPFLVIETSFNSYQAWLCFDKLLTEEAVKGIKKFYLSDPGATGSCRLAGSFNYKEKYSPNYPQVKLIHFDKEAVLNTESLADFDFPNESVFNQKHRKEKLCSPFTGPKVQAQKKSASPWPFYDRALRMAPLRRDCSGIDRSQADYIWAWTALSWGHEAENVIRRLVKLSEKAREKSEEEAFEYAANTVYSAARRL